MISNEYQAVPNNENKQCFDLLSEITKEYEWLLIQLQPIDCPICGEGEAFLSIDDWLLHRVCNKCGSDFGGTEELKWNAKNKHRRTVMNGYKP